MKIFWVIAFIVSFNSCKQEATGNTGGVDSSAASVPAKTDYDQTQDFKITKLIVDTVSLAARLRAITTRVATVENRVTASSTRVIALEADSLAQRNQINSLQMQITGAVTRNAIQEGIIGKLIADTIYKSKQIKALQGTSPVIQIPLMQTQIKGLQTKDKTMQASIDNMGTQIIDTAFGIRNFINSISMFADSLQFSTTNRILRIPVLPSIIQSIEEVKTNIIELQNQIPAKIK